MAIKNQELFANEVMPHFKAAGRVQEPALA
jgi:hypothetical protein